MDSVLTDFQTVQTKWDSLLFLSKKYDSVPYPSQEVLGYHMAKLKRIESLIKLKAALDRAIEAGVYDKNGREIKK